ncbi:FecR domain-containing protein [bacterium]|nr:FecR domain-containing protein [bacterium]
MKILRVSLILIMVLIIGSSINIVSPYRATVIKIEGTVLKKVNLQNIWVPVNKGDILDSGDSLKTGENSYAELRFSDGSTVKINPETEVSIYRDYLSLAIGYVRLYITKLFPNFEVRTPSAIAGVRGTEFSVEVLEDQTTIVTVYEGEVDVTAQGRTLRLRKGESGIVKPKSPPEINPVGEKGRNDRGESAQHRLEDRESGKNGNNRPSRR